MESFLVHGDAGSSRMKEREEHGRDHSHYNIFKQSAVILPHGFSWVLVPNFQLVILETECNRLSQVLFFGDNHSCPVHRDMIILAA